MSKIIRRKAILIASPGSDNSFLPGTQRDLTNIRNFLKSESGGAWHEGEIETLYDPYYFQVKRSVENTIADYVFVYFSGHGYTDSESNRMICLRDYHISDTSLLNESPRQLVLIDACRNLVGTGLGEIQFPEPEFFNFDGSLARSLFSTHISKSPAGKLIIHGTQSGQYSYDSPTGGMFTSAVLGISARINAPVTYTTANIKTVLKYVPNVLEKRGNSQIPSIAYEEGNLRVPFAIGVPRGVYAPPKKRKEINQRPMPSTTGNGWAGATLAVVIIGILIAASK